MIDPHTISGYENIVDLPVAPEGNAWYNFSLLMNIFNLSDLSKSVFITQEDDFSKYYLQKPKIESKIEYKSKYLETEVSNARVKWEIKESLKNDSLWISIDEGIISRY